jgi:hypothetical protein
MALHKIRAWLHANRYTITDAALAVALPLTILIILLTA